MIEKVQITLEFEGNGLKSYKVTCSDPSILEKKKNEIEPYYELSNGRSDKLRIETYFGELSGDGEIKGGNNWSLPKLAILFTELYDEEKVPLKQTAKLKKIKRWIGRARPFDLNSEWVE